MFLAYDGFEGAYNYLQTERLYILVIALLTIGLAFFAKRYLPRFISWFKLRKKPIPLPMLLISSYFFVAMSFMLAVEMGLFDG